MKRTTFFKTFSLLLGVVMALGMAVPALAAEGFTAAFAVVGGSAAVNVYYTQDYTSPDETDAATALARDGDTGEILTDGSGQINFTVIPAEGYEVAGVAATEGTYKNVKGPADTGAENTYRITKITGDLTVTITLQEATGEAREETGDTVITFTDDAATVSGSSSGVSVSGTDVKITAAGTYTFTGSCAKGSIVVKKNVTGVTLVLDGLTLTASATAPITCNKGSEVTILAAAGSVNTLSDDQYNNDDVYTDATLYPDIENAVIKCKDGSNVVIGGMGTINVNAYGKNGVKGGADLYEEDADGNYTDTLLSTASLTIKDVTLNVTIKHSYKDPDDASAYDGDAIKSEKELNILSGNITVSANDDGVKCDYVMNIGAEGTDGPTVTVTKSNEGIEAATLNVYSGNVKVNATDDGVNAANGDLTGYSFSYNQYGGTVWVNCENGDGLDSNGAINLLGGVFEVHSPTQGDGDPIDGDGTVTFGGATVLGMGHNAMQNGYNGVYVTFGSAQQGGMNGFGGREGFGGMGGGTATVTAGSTVAIKDGSGNTVYTTTAVRDASYVVYADAAMEAGDSYTLYVNGAQAATGTAVSNTQQGGFPGGQGGNPGGQQGGFPGQGGGRGGFPGQDDGQSSFPGGQPTPPDGGQPTQPGGAWIGDVDGDGSITAADARLALRASVGLETLTEAQKAAADVDHDGSVTAADARLILRASVGLETLA